MGLLLKERHSTVDLLVLITLDKLIFLLEILFIFVTKKATLMRKLTVLNLHLQLVFPVYSIVDSKAVSDNGANTLTPWVAN
jgi:hypothetical protein